MKIFFPAIAASQVLPVFQEIICYSFNISLHCPQRFRTLPTTGRRLGEAAADTKRYAGYCRSCSHVTFSGVTAAVAPNRTLCRWHFCPSVKSLANLAITDWRTESKQFCLYIKNISFLLPVL